jgi:hypothetical protein
VKGDIQDVKNAVKLELASSAFLAVLAAVDAEKGVATATPGPTQVFAGEKFVKSDQGYPVIEIVGVRTIYGETDEQGKAAVHEVQVIWTHVGDDEMTITAELERMVRATRDYFWPALGPIVLPGINAQPLAYGPEEYVELMPAKDHPFVKGSAVTLRVPTITL